MGYIDKYYEKKALIDKLTSEVEAMEKDEAIQQELELKKKLEELMSQYGKSANDTLHVLNQIDPSLNLGSAIQRGNGNKKRAMITYKNPHTGEEVQTRGGNQKTLKQWREEYGKEEVDSWKQA